MPKWVSVDPKTLKIATHRSGQFRGVEIIEGLSPDDIPEKIRAATDEGRCVVYLEYLSNFKEPRLVIHKFRSVTPVVGRHSGRLYELRFSDTDLQKLPGHVRTAIDALSSDDRFLKHQRHYKVAGEAISENAGNLLPQ